MFGHVDNLRCGFYGLKRRLRDSLGGSHKSNHGTVGGRSGVNIQKGNTVNGLYAVGDAVYNIHISTFAEIGHTFNKFHNIYSPRCLWFNPGADAPGYPVLINIIV